MSNENMHTCIRNLTLTVGKNYDVYFREGVMYERFDDGGVIKMEADDGCFHAISPEVYEEHFLFDSGADIERLRAEGIIQDSNAGELSMKNISIKKFAEMAMGLKLGASIRFHHTDEDANTMEYFATRLSMMDSDCLLANCVGGGRPLVIDVTTYDSSLRDICEELDQYINYATGRFGSVTILESKAEKLVNSDFTAPRAGGYMLVSVTEREIEAAFFPNYEAACAQMKKELEETMTGDRENYAEGDDYGVYEFSAWSNANQNAISDWLIVKLSDTGLACPCIHLDWSTLDDIVCSRLSFCAERRIDAHYDHYETYHWGFNIAGTPLSKEELEKLFTAYGADDFDRESNDLGEYPIMEINQGLAEKLVAPELPFILDSSLADAQGVWFFGAPCGEQLTVLVRYPETDMEPDVVRFTLNENTTKKALLTCINRTVAGIKRRKDEDDDRLSKFDDFIDRVKEKTGCCATVVNSHHEIEIW